VSAQLKFSKRLEFSQFPRDWNVSSVALDWNGSPLLLVQEGKPPYPTEDTSIEARLTWFNTAPKAHHLVHWEGTTQRVLTFDKSTRPLASSLQPFGEGWLSGEGDVYDGAGRLLRTLDLGYASNDMQTTPTGHIWVSYSDEGVFGHGIGIHGVVCFDASGQPIFKYSEFAEQNQLPDIADCYAMNVVSDDEVWLSYYTDFPLVSLRNFRLGRIWNKFGCIDRSFALLGESVVFPKCYTRSEGKSQLLRRTLSDSAQSEPLDVVDETGAPFAGIFSAFARGPHFYLLTETALFKLGTT
jgi:hypothetical protein